MTGIFGEKPLLNKFGSRRGHLSKGDKVARRGRSLKGNKPKTPKENANTSTIKKYLTKDGSTKSLGLEKQQQGNKDKKKRPWEKKKGEAPNQRFQHRK